jgi:hypothetical protein
MPLPGIRLSGLDSVYESAEGCMSCTRKRVRIRWCDVDANACECWWMPENHEADAAMTPREDHDDGGRRTRVRS